MAATPRPLIVGNWKMNGLRQDGIALSEALAAQVVRDAGLRCDLAICPPVTLLEAAGLAIKGSAVALGAQDCHPSDKGAHTGDIAAPMLADAGCVFVIVGHSERRANHGEDDALVRAKAEAALAAGLTSIVCVGETERDAGRTLDIVGRQIEGSLPSGATAANTVIAYEPVWAIGTGRTPTTAEIAEVHAMIRGRAEAGIEGGAVARLLYGGSVKPDNATEILAIADVNGALVGGASLDAEDFWAIAQSCK